MPDVPLLEAPRSADARRAPDPAGRGGLPGEALVFRAAMAAAAVWVIDDAFWHRYLRERPDVRDGRIGGLGLSVGGELLLQTAAHDPGLRAVVSEGAGLRSVAEQKHADRATPGAPHPRAARQP